MTNLTPYLTPYLTPFVQIMIFVACTVAFTLYCYINYWRDMRRADRARIMERLTETPLTAPTWRPIHTEHYRMTNLNAQKGASEFKLRAFHLGGACLSTSLTDASPRTILWRIANRLTINRVGNGLNNGGNLYLETDDRDAVRLLLNCRDELIFEMVEYQTTGMERHSRPVNSPLEI